jgi:hypothetical protein
LSYGSKTPGALETAPGLYFDRARSRPAVSSTGQMAAQAGVAPAPFRLTSGRTTVIPLSIQMVGTAGFSPAASRSQAGRSKEATLREIGQRGEICTPGRSAPNGACCCYTTRCCPGEWQAPAAWFLWRRTHAFPGIQRPSEIWRTRRDLHPQPSRRQRGALLIELRVQFEMVGSAGNAPVRRFRLCFATPDLQSGSRITTPQ